MSRPKVLCLAVEASDPMLGAQLQQLGWHLRWAKDADELKQLARSERAHVGLVCLPPQGGLPGACMDACAHLAHLEWVALVASETLMDPDACHTMVSHFSQHHTYPVDQAALHLSLQQALARFALRQRAAMGRQRDLKDLMGMAGRSLAIDALRSHIGKVASTDAPVLLSGESGSGKELAAQAIHQRSARAAQPFIAVNCGAMASTLIQSELFGHERGAFTGATTAKAGLIEAADGGTIFLDEIADLPLDLQTNLLRFLQEQTIQRLGATRSIKVDVRVIAASHVDLSDAVAAGRFREDLYYRLNVLPLRVPSLRERVSDIPTLADHFLHQCLARGSSRRIVGFAKEAVSALQGHDWPGNVRELRNRVQRAVVMSEQRLISAADLGLAGVVRPPLQALEAARLQAERDAIMSTLGLLANNVSRSAKALGVSRMTLYRLMDKHGMHIRAD